MIAVDAEARLRRNRSRVRAVTVVATVNLWLLTIVTFTAAALLGSRGRVLVAPGLALVCILASATVSVAGLVHQLLRNAAPSALKRMGAVVPEEPLGQELRNLASGLAIARGLPVAPAVRVSYDPALNAIAVGRGPASSVIVVTTGLVKALSRAELEAVIAVETCAIAVGDAALGTVAMGLIGATVRASKVNTGEGAAEHTSLARLPFRLVADRLRRLSDRGRTNALDLLAVETTRNPAALAGALAKIEAGTARVQSWTRDDFDSWFAPPSTRVPGTDVRPVSLPDRIEWLERDFGPLARVAAG